MPEVVLPEENHEPKAGAPAVTETNIPEPPKHRPLVMTDHDAIGVFENGMPNDICDAVIHSFEHWYAKKYIVNENDAKKEKKGLWAGNFEMPWEWRKKRK